MNKGSPSAGCPVTGAVSPTGCPVSDRAAAFDPFEGAYQVDPAEALRWSREEEPVFYSPKLGYWVVTRYDDVKAIFRDNKTFSPAIALEKITPVSSEAEAVLKKYNFGLARTLVNEDEPAHMARRRVLMKSFEVGELAKHEAMVRRLTREYIDRLIDRGEADLVDDMLWEIPLTVALHFLGVPEEDMDRIREYSIAHTVNTWGRPTRDEQIAVAEAVGKFWVFAGEVLERMRENPAGDGWMAYAIRQQKLYPDVVTDSYLHSIMMAGIVAAHETTANASGAMFRILLENRDVWEEVCANPSVIPNTVEECLRLVGSVSAWRRITTADTEIDGVNIPAGAKLLIVSSSANHDPRHFENPDELDIYRDGTADHLTFGYGAHQCMGKNLARMEMRIFLEEFSRRLPHMELVPGQEFTYLPNTSFRGPDHVHVKWDPAENPERRNPAALEPRASYPVGAPSKQDAERPITVAERITEADGVVSLVLKDPRGKPLPRWSAGGHIDLVVGDYVRQYSLCGDPEDRMSYRIAILREAGGRGGSAHVHDHVTPGTTLRMRGPKNHFRLREDAQEYQLIAGGIGITPVLAMADRLKRLGKPYHLHYAGRDRAHMAFLKRATRDHDNAVTLYPSGERRLELAWIIENLPAAGQVYACGPERLLQALDLLMAERPGDLHVEHFTVGGNQLDPEKEHEFEVELEDSGFTVTVRRDQTMLEALRTVGIDLPSDCEEGLCGTCEAPVSDGAVDHRDKVLTDEERGHMDRMMCCCSRAQGKKLRVRL